MIGHWKNSLIILTFVSHILSFPTSVLSSVEFEVTSHFNDKRYGSLNNWLWNLKVLIPDQTFKESVFSLSIVNMFCTHFEVESIKSDYIPSAYTDSEKKNPSIDVNVAGISASCTGEYKSTGLSGNIAATVTPSKPEALGISLEFESEYRYKIRMATSTSAKRCNANLKCNDIEFSGSPSAWVINLFKSPIQGYISENLSTQICPVLNNLVDEQLTELIKKD